MQDLKTVDDVRAEFERKGVSFSEWARKNNVSVPAVYDLLNGRTIGRRGDAHKAAVLLGIKRGEIGEITGRAA